MEIQVSVLTTAYNHAPFIAQAIKGILAQKTSFAFELIVHDDASTDSTPRIIEEYAKRHPDIIKPILQQQNQFSQGNDVYSFMLPLARGKYIALCEGDDYWCDPCKLQKQVDYMENHPECSYCFCNAYRVDVQGNVIGQQSPVHQSRVFSDREIIAATPDNPLNFPATAGVLCRTKDLMDCPTDFKAGEVGDMPLRFMLMLKGNAYGFADLMCCYRIMTPGSWTERGARESKFDPVKASQRNQAFIDFYHRFDQYTNGIYHQEIMPNIQWRVYLEYARRADWKAIRQMPYWQFYQKDTRKRRAIIYLKAHFPFLLQLYRRLRYGPEVQRRKQAFDTAPPAMKGRYHDHAQKK